MNNLKQRPLATPYNPTGVGCADAYRMQLALERSPKRQLLENHWGSLYCYDPFKGGGRKTFYNSEEALVDARSRRGEYLDFIIG